MNRFDAITKDLLRAIAPGGEPRFVVIDGCLGSRCGDYARRLRGLLRERAFRESVGKMINFLPHCECLTSRSSPSPA